jgi:hypothetical protein
MKCSNFKGCGACRVQRRACRLHVRPHAPPYMHAVTVQTMWPLGLRGVDFLPKITLNGIVFCNDSVFTCHKSKVFNFIVI